MFTCVTLTAVQALNFTQQTQQAEFTALLNTWAMAYCFSYITAEYQEFYVERLWFNEIVAHSKIA